jgi:tetratricopeptide (TPR) repeat protein
VWWTASFLALVVLVGPARAEDEEVRKKVLALNALTGADPMRGALKGLLDDSEGTKKLLAVASKMAKDKPQPFNRNATFLLALAAENVKDVDASAQFYRLNAKQSLQLLSERGVAQAYGGLIQMYYDNKKYGESEKACQEVLRIEGNEDEALERIRPLIMRRMILSIAKQGAVDRALALVERMIKADPENWLALALKGQVQRESGKLEESAKTFLAVIEQVKTDKRIEKEDRQEYIDEYRYLLSGIYADMEQIDKAAEQLKELLAREPNNPTYNNDLGYIWADRNLHLAEAEKLIRKALEEDRKLRKAKPDLKPDEDKDSSAYLDSMGWVLFKQGKLKEAKEYLLLAVKEKEGQHIEILDHLADVHQALGEKAEAIATWKKALEGATDSKRDQKRKAEIEKKLKEEK